MPPARWRDWYPHKIDKWRGSPSVQAMSDGAYRGYHNLIMAQWQTEDGMLPADDRELKRLSGLFRRWHRFRAEIIVHFRTHEKRLFNQVQYDNWNKAREVYEKRARLHPESDHTVVPDGPESGHSLTQAGVNVIVSSLGEEEIQDKGELFELSSEEKKKLPLAEQCEAIYRCYPRHEARGAAHKAIEKSLKKIPFEELLARVELYSQNTRREIATGRKEKQFIPHPATWFNREQWDDEALTKCYKSISWDEYNQATGNRFDREKNAWFDKEGNFA